MKKGLIILAATALFWLTQLNIGLACSWHAYEPEVPEILR